MPRGQHGVVVLTGAENGNPDAERAQLRRATTSATWCASPASCRTSTGEPPRLYVVTTRNAQTVLAGDVNNLEQAGLRGLLRVIGSEHPHLHATQIDVDEQTRTPSRWRGNCWRPSEEDETAWRNGEWYTARLCPAPLRPEERRTTVVDHAHDGMRAADPHAR